jgi:hypothetical protein
MRCSRDSREAHVGFERRSLEEERESGRTRHRDRRILKWDCRGAWGSVGVDWVHLTQRFVNVVNTLDFIRRGAFLEQPANIG